MAKILTLLTLIASVVLGCTTTGPTADSSQRSWFMKSDAPDADSVTRKLLVGLWFSDSNDADGVHRMELKTLRADGTFEISFRGTKNGKIVADQTEYGLWGVCGDIYFTITQGYVFAGRSAPVSPQDATYYDAYRIRHVSADRLEYTHVVAGHSFAEKKVPAGFQLPGDEI